MRKLLLESVLTVTYGVACFMTGAYLMYIEGPKVKIELVGPATPVFPPDPLPIGTICVVPPGVYMGYDSYGKGYTEIKNGYGMSK